MPRTRNRVYGRGSTLAPAAVLLRSTPPVFNAYECHDSEGDTSEKYEERQAHKKQSQNNTNPYASFITQGEKRKRSNQQDAESSGPEPGALGKKQKAGNRSGKKAIQRHLITTPNILAGVQAGVAAGHVRIERDVVPQKTLENIKAQAAENQARKAALQKEARSSKSICSHFLRGSCRYGNACRMNHPVGPPRKTDAEFRAEWEVHRSVPEDARDRIWYLQELANLRDLPAFDEISTWCVEDLSTREQIKYWSAVFRKLLEVIDSLHAWDAILGICTTTDDLSDLCWRCKDFTRLRTVLAASIEAEVSMDSRTRHLVRLQVDVNDVCMKLCSGTPFPDGMDELAVSMSMLVLEHAARPIEMKNVKVSVSKVLGSHSFISWLRSRV